MRIGILGGSFDPPHIGHLLVARQTLEVMKLDQVWLMPYFAHSWDNTFSSPSDRLLMTKLTEEEKIITSVEEIDNKTKSYTIDTVRRLKQKFSHTFFWIVGSDELKDFKRWKDYQQLVKEITFLVFPRNRYPLPDISSPGFSLVSSPYLVTSNISSTIVRSRLKNNLSVEGLISEPVLSYITKHKLYGY